MPPKKNTENGDSGSPPISGVNWRLVDAVFKFCPPSAKPNIDWNALAETTGHKNGKSARDSYRMACEKFGWFKADGGNPAGAGSSPTTPAKKNTPNNKSAKSSTKKQASVLKDVNDDASADEVDTPSKTKKRKANNAGNGHESPSKKSKLKDEIKDEAKDEIMDEAKAEQLDEA
ncbi:hypothetical protein PG990_012730 [Apiospora arundinis]